MYTKEASCWKLLLFEKVKKIKESICTKNAVQILTPSKCPCLQLRKTIL